MRIVAWWTRTVPAFLPPDWQWWAGALLVETVRMIVIFTMVLGLVVIGALLTQKG